MIIDFNDPNQLMSPVLLSNAEVCKAVANNWKVDPKNPEGKIEVTPTVQMNGVEVPPEVLEEVLQAFWSQLEEHYKHKYADLDKLAYKKAKEILEGLHTDLVDILNDYEYRT